MHMSNVSDMTKYTQNRNTQRRIIDTTIKQFRKNKPIPKNISPTKRQTNINRNETGQRTTEEKECSHVSLEKDHPSQTNVKHNESEQR